jgi:hypothetical protein
MMLRNIACAAVVGTGLIASASAAGAWGFYPRAVPLHLSPLSGSDARTLDGAPAGTEQASLKPVCRPWPPFGNLCTASSGSDAGMPAGRSGLNTAGSDRGTAAGDPNGVLSRLGAAAESRIRLARGFGCPYTDWAGTGYGIPC